MASNRNMELDALRRPLRISTTSNSRRELDMDVKVNMHGALTLNGSQRPGKGDSCFCRRNSRIDREHEHIHNQWPKCVFLIAAVLFAAVCSKCRYPRVEADEEYVSRAPLGAATDSVRARDLGAKTCVARLALCTCGSCRFQSR
jgi:hypothetical protein